MEHLALSDQLEFKANPESQVSLVPSDRWELQDLVVLKVQREHKDQLELAEQTELKEEREHLVFKELLVTAGLTDPTDFLERLDLQVLQDP